MRVSTLFCIFLFNFCMLLPEAISASRFYVFGIHNPVPMENSERPVKDLYVNIGTDQGVKKGTTLDAYRILTTTDNTANRSATRITFKIATLTVIHAENNVAVARIKEFMPLENTPHGGYNAILVGDLVAVSRK